jgi:hypothetical protein
VSEKEKSAALLFKKILGKKIDDVRFIDAHTLIYSMDLPTNRKNQLLNLLHHGSWIEIQEEITKLIANSTFENDALKEKVTQNLLSECAHSKIRRDEILVAIGWVESRSHALSEGVMLNLKAYSSRKLNFCETNKDGAFVCYNKMTVDYSSVFLHETLFDSSYTVETTNRQSYHYHCRNWDGIFHEFGHMTSMYMPSAAENLGRSQRCWEVVAASAVVNLTPDAMWHNLKVMNDANEQEFDTVMKFVSSAVLGKTITLDRTQSMRWLVQHSTYFFNMMWHAPFACCELFQIMGIFAGSYWDRVSSGVKNMLYVNLLSDSSYSIEKGFPIRWSHRSENASKADKIEVDKTPKIDKKIAWAEVVRHEQNK